MGLVLGYFICYGTANISSSLSFRLPLAIQSIGALFLAVTSFFYLPPSPRWLAFKGRKAEASTAWDTLGVSEAEREKDILQNTTDTMEGETARPSSMTEAAKVGLLGHIRGNMIMKIGVLAKENRRQMFLGVFMMSMQQLSGIDGVLYVSNYSILPSRAIANLAQTVCTTSLLTGRY